MMLIIVLCINLEFIYKIPFKNTYENKGFKASLTPMIGVNDLAVIDFDTDKVQTVTNNFLSEFAAINGKIKNIFAINSRKKTKNDEADKLLNFIWENFNMLPFALRWITKEWEEKEAK